MRWLRRSFAARLTLAFVLVGMVGAGLATLLVNVAFEGRFGVYLEQQQSQREGQLVATLAASYVRSGGWVPDDLEAAVHPLLMEGAELALHDPDGALVWHSDEHPMAEMHPHPGSPPLGDPRTLAVQVDGEPVGVVETRLPQPGLLPVDAAFRTEVNRLLLLGGAAAAVVALVLGVVLARRTTGRARRLTSAARSLASGDRSSRVPDLGHDELGEVGLAFNRMANAVESQDRLRRGFAADVAHELRTPLAILQGRLESIQDGLVSPDAQEIDSLHGETLRLSRLVADLETLARADAAAFTLAREHVDLAVLVGDVAAEHRAGLEDRAVTLRVTTDPLTAEADATRVRQILDNLLSNAAKFTPDGGRVHVRLRRDGDHAVIDVADSGPGVAEDKRERIFDRFYRGDGARASGSGIGLTVVRDLVEAHGGTVSMGDSPDGGAQVIVRLPLSADASNAAGSDAGDGRGDGRPDVGEPHRGHTPPSRDLHEADRG